MKTKKIAIIVLTLILLSTLRMAFNVPTAGEADENSNLNGVFSEEVNKPLSENRVEWNFDETSEWGELAYINEGFARLVIGVSNHKSNTCSELMSTIIQHQGEVVNTISIKSEIIAAIVDISLEAASSFAAEVSEAELASYIEPNIKFKAQLVPDDPHWGTQWGPQKIEADSAWDTTVGNSSVLVAVVDTGIDYNHPDLQANYVPLGFDHVNNDPNPIDDEGHGTHCAGIIAAELNNSVGIAGLAQVEIMAEKGLNKLGEGYADWLANAIIHATEQGADIISMSWGGFLYSELIHESIKYAYNAGVLLIASAGNEETSVRSFPAGYDEVIAVTATDVNDNTASWSNFGDWVELAAPGVDIYSTFLGDQYVSMSGTSMACPHVAGVAALVWTQFSYKSRNWVRLQLRYTSDDKGFSGFDIRYGYGRANARKAVEQAPPDHDLAIYEWKTPPYAEPGSPTTINATILNFGTCDETNVTVELMANDIAVNSTIISFLASSESMVVSLGWNSTVEGRYNVALHVESVPSETIIENNVASARIHVGFPLKAVVLDSAGNRLSHSIGTWQEINTNWHLFGSTMIYIDYTTLKKEDITYEDIVATNADVLIISCAYDPDYGWQFTNSEIEAIEQYVFEGHGIIATAGTLYHLVPNNNKLAPLFGLDETITWSDTTTYNLHLTEPEHMLFTKIPNPYSFPEIDTTVSPDGQWDENELTSGRYVALGGVQESAIVTNTRGRIFISPWLETIDLYMHSRHLQLLYNAITWSPHELGVSLDAPLYVPLNESVLLNATIYNVGTTNETDVVLQLLINGSLLNSMVIPELQNGSSYTLNYSWTPEEGTYNITAYAPPVSGETYIANNTLTKIVKVSQNRDIALLAVSSPSKVYPGRRVNITINAKNLGELAETFNVTVYYDSTPIGVVKVVDLLPSQNVTLMFTWNTTGLQACYTHTIWAEATTVPGEIDVENNVFIYGPVKIKMLGDIDGDGEISIYDVVLAASIYGSNEGNPDWNPEADVAPPIGVINIYDIVTITSSYGQTC